MTLEEYIKQELEKKIELHYGSVDVKRTKVSVGFCESFAKETLKKFLHEEVFTKDSSEIMKKVLIEGSWIDLTEVW